MKKRRFLPLLLSICLLLGLFAGCGAAKPSAGNTAVTPQTPDNTTATEVNKRSLKTASSYEEVFKAIQEAQTRNTAGGSYGMNAAVPEAGKAATNGAAAAPAPAADSGSVAGGPDYSQTNVQVKGVDEGDIVKTDGSYIYVLRNNELLIFKADGAATAKVSAVKVIADNTGDKTVTDLPAPAPSGITALPEISKPVAPQYTNEYASDIYVTGNTAVVVSSLSSYMPYVADGSSAKTAIAYGGNKQIAKIYIYDITDRAKPVLKTELGQDGYPLTTRLVGETLYMISVYYVYNAAEGDNKTFIPSLYTGSTAKLVSPDAIAIMPSLNSTAYTIVCAYDLKNGAIGPNQTMLGGGTNVYMNADTLYIANSTSSQTAGTPYTDSVYTVVDYKTDSVTDLASFDLTGGGLKLKASGSVPGSLNSQFNMDEYDGKLRVVTTTFSQSWSEYTDKAKGFVNYIWKDPASANALYVLDADLKVMGSIGDLAPGEQVYSVRYDGTIGYIVTFRQVDPLFAVDLSDPAKPAVLSALKIPGFSEYLHIWGQGRLFGLGMNADAQSGRTDGMKLAMFDTSDPTNVKVKHELKLTTNWSTALYNHKAILISPEKGLIAFPAESGYDIYSYSDEQGFTKRATISNLQWDGNGRGLYIDSFAYIVDSSAVTVLDMTGFKLVSQLKY